MSPVEMFSVIDPLAVSCRAGWTRPDELVSSLIFFNVACVMLAVTWFLVYAVSNVVLANSFGTITPVHKKVY